MQTARKALSALLLLSLLLTSLPLSAGASVADGPLPAGYHATGRTMEDESGVYAFYIESEPSKNGWIDGYWVDSSGRRLEPEDKPLLGADAPSSVTELPAAYDAREEGLVLPVVDQVGGTCWAHAAIACIEANALKNGYLTRENAELSAYHIIWHARSGHYEGVSDAANDGPICAKPSDILSAGGNDDYVRSMVYNFTGPAAEADYHFTQTNSENALLQEMTARFQEVGYSAKRDHELVVSDAHNVELTTDAIKEAVLTYGIVELSYYSNNRYYATHSRPGQQVTVYYSPTDRTPDHAVNIVGWDDDFSVDNFTVAGAKPKHNGAWLVKNSWGEDWGTDGYFWMSYEDATIDAVSVYETEPNDIYQNIYLYDGYGWGAVLDGPVAAANVFTAKRNECLTKVSLGEAVDEYSFSIYRLNEDASDPTDGTLLHSQSGDNNGGRYIDLSELIRLQAGERFSVVFDKLSRIYLEGTSLSDAVYQSDPGQSYYKQKDGKWVDSQSVGRNNVCIRAITKDISANSHLVTFTCPGFHTEYRESVGSLVAIPTVQGCTTVCTVNGRPFVNSNVTDDITVEMHCYPTEGAKKESGSCTVEYRCIYCGREMLPAIERHTTEKLDAIAPTCSAGGRSEAYRCTTCDRIFTDAACTHETDLDQIRLEPIDHTDADHNGHCDMCDTVMPGADICPYCGKDHGKSFIGKITRFLHNILGFFKNLFN